MAPFLNEALLNLPVGGKTNCVCVSSSHLLIVELLSYVLRPEVSARHGARCFVIGLIYKARPQHALGLLSTLCR